MKDLRIVFMGTPAFASNILEGLLSNGFNIVGVVTQPDKEVGRKRILTPSPVKEVALRHNLPVIQPRKIREDYQEIIDLNPELIITSAYGQIVPEVILNYPKYHCINTHGSLLPKYRGGSPIQRSIMNGDEYTGMTIMYMSKGMDEGDIIKQEKLKIELDDTNTTVFKKLSDLALKMLLELDINDISPIKQDESLVTYAYNLTKEDEYINFNDDVLSVYNHIRGLLDNPGAYSILDNKKYKFHKVRFLNKENDLPGKVLGLNDNALEITCLNGSILVDEIQPEGKNKMNAKDFYNGAGKTLVGKVFDYGSIKD